MAGIKTLLIYANSSVSTGNGHVMRQLALAQQAVEKNFNVYFIYQQQTEYCFNRIKNEGFNTWKIEDDKLVSFINTAQASAIVLDTYFIQNSLLDVIEKLTIPVVFFDDQVLEAPINTTLIINSADNIDLSNNHQTSTHRQYCLGPKYRLIRNEFIDKKASDINPIQNQHLLFTLGGADIKQLTLALIKLIAARAPHINIDVVIGNKNDKQLPELLTLSQSSPHICIHQHVDNMAELMLQAKLAITAAGGTLFELLAMGVPSIAICVAENQRQALESENRGYIVFDLSITEASASSALMLQSDLQSKLHDIAARSLALWQQPETLMLMSNQANNYIDGLGAQRVVNAIEEIIK